MTSLLSEAGQIGSGTTMFNQTCDRLRGYLKENGSLGITFPISSSSSRTLNLFPTSTQNSALSRVNNSFSSLDTPTNCDHVNNNNVADDHVMTIFYNGQVIVLEDVSRDKANEVMRVAASLSLSPTSRTRDLGQLDLSHTRSRSLTRFFEKRKDRINARAPYTLRDKSWLGLSAAAPPN